MRRSPDHSRCACACRARPHRNAPLAGVVADPRRSGPAVETVGLEIGETRLDRRNAIAVAREAVAALSGAGERIGPRPARSGERADAAQRAVAAGLGAEVELRRSAAFPGDDVHHAADRVRAVQRALRAAQHLDALDRADRHHREVVVAARRGRIVDPHAVDQHQRLARLAPRNRTLVVPPGPPVSLTSRPGTPRSASTRLSGLVVAISACGTTLIALPVRLSDSSPRVAVTTNVRQRLTEDCASA